MGIVRYWRLRRERETERSATQMPEAAQDS
jgi:hypothetical protein